MEMTPILPTAATFLMEIALKSVLVTLAALIALRLLRGAAPALRYRVALAAFVLLTLLPSSAFLPGIPMNALSASFFSRFAAPEASPVVETSAPLALPAPKILRPETRPLPPPAPFASPVAAPINSKPVAPATLLGAVWAGITVSFIFPFALGLWRLRQLFQSAAPADDRTLTLTQQAAARLKIAPPAVRFSHAVSVPVAFGKDNPAIVLPAFAADWDDARLYAALLHESAHIARCDFGAQCMARIVCALYGWSPLAWQLYAVLRAEAEADCDARAVASGSSSGMTAPDYAAHLFAIAKQAGTQSVPFAPFAQAMARPNRPHLLEERIQMILTPAHPLNRRRAALILAIAALCAIPSILLRPALARDGKQDIRDTAKLAAPIVLPAATTPTPTQNAEAFLKWSMNQYAAAKFFRATWTWNLAFPQMPGGTQEPHDFRSIVYAAPNKFRVVSTTYKTLVHEYISDGEKMVIIKRGYDQGPESFDAPKTMAYADENNMSHPHFGGSFLYRFFGGAAGLPRLLDSDLQKQVNDPKRKANNAAGREWDESVNQRLAPPISFGPDVVINGEPCKTVIFNGGLYYDERRAVISVRDGFARRLLGINHAKPLSAEQIAEHKRDFEQTMASDFVKTMPAQKRAELRKAMENGLEGNPAAITTEEFQEIALDAPLYDLRFSTKIDYPSVGTEAPDVTLQRQEDGATAKLSELRGKPVLLLFSAADGFKPTLPATLAPLKLEGVTLLPVTKKVQVMAGVLPLYRDPNGDAYKAFDVRWDEVSFVLIDKDGKIAARGIDLTSMKPIAEALDAAGIPQ